MNETFNDIQKRMSQYCRFVDTKQWEQLAELVIPDVQMRFEDVQGQTIAAFHSPAEFIAACRGTIETAATAHHLHNPELTLINADEAQAVWAMEDRWYMPEGAPFHLFHGYGHYHVQFVKREGRWLIKDLLLTRIRIAQS